MIKRISHKILKCPYFLKHRLHFISSFEIKMHLCQYKCTYKNLIHIGLKMKILILLYLMIRYLKNQSFIGSLLYIYTIIHVSKCKYITI